MPTVPSEYIWRSRPETYFKECLQIQDKVSRAVIPFVLSRGQKLVQGSIDRQRRQGRPIRILLLKYRQGGYSTSSEANIFHTCRFYRGNYMVVSMDADSAEHIFSITDRFYHYLPASEKAAIPTVASNRKELKFAEPHGGRIIVETAGKKAAGHSFTLAGLHLSEVSRWPDDTEDARAGLLNSIPESPNTVIIVESVANGMSGWFYKEWHKPDSMYEKIFCPWFWQDDYKMTLPIPEAQYGAQLSDEERKIRTMYDLSLEQMEWRRFVIHNKHDDDIEKFKEQYPSTAAEAFRASGNQFFSHAALDSVIPVDPLVGEVKEWEDEAGVKNVTFLLNSRGKYRVWKKPTKNHEYVLAADVAEGIEIEGAPNDDRHDYSSADVLDRDTGEQVCQLHGRITPDEFGRMVALLGKYYNHAYVGVESNAGYGLHVLDEMKDAGYPEHLLYKQQTLDESTKRPTTKLGWRTTKANRKTLMSQLDMSLRRNEVIVNSEDTHTELKAFVTKPDGRIEHGAGHKDDRVFSLAIAYEMLGAAPPRKHKTGGTSTAASVSSSYTPRRLTSAGPMSIYAH